MGVLSSSSVTQSETKGANPSWRIDTRYVEPSSSVGGVWNAPWAPVVGGESNLIRSGGLRPSTPDVGDADPRTQTAIEMPTSGWPDSPRTMPTSRPGRGTLSVSLFPKSSAGARGRRSPDRKLAL